ncbi:aminopeptidase [Pendulispora rubella]|uniref:Aminopeptidase n=1 Tax=Pendulispora rubella TaxID=2741070 RepID=A0ABZ2KQA8_9BACT
MTWKTVFGQLARCALRAMGLLLLLLTSSCAKLEYVRQAAAGQYDLGTRARNIDELVDQRHVDARTRRLLSEVARIKGFGEQNGLTPTKNYRKYVRVDRDFVVWVTSASEPLRFRSKSWGFPLVGSFTYLGWFSQKDAQAYAKEIRSKGWDVDVRGSAAYSTTGYFEDPVLSTMIREGDAAMGSLTNVILHEMTHATFFVRRQSTLNESVANFVGNTLAETYLERTIGPDAKETVAYLASQEQIRRRGEAMREAYRSLDLLYGSTKPKEEKLAIKKELLTKLRANLGFKRPINNATLIQYKTYNSGQDELALLLASCDDSFPRFIRVLKTLETKTWPKDQEKDIGRIILPLVTSNACRAAQ